jgi:hypothetical protein
MSFKKDMIGAMNLSNSINSLDRDYVTKGKEGELSNLIEMKPKP